ncbi:MAG: hypothetical protein D3904_16170, partial [Candidatus Electrothrix sp. EH2]|nr:hypothetical protein [Candidatus Electrothrix sp. EH2]
VWCFFQDDIRRVLAEMGRTPFLCNQGVTGLAVFFLIVIPLTGQAEPEPALVVDGRYKDWDLKKDNARPMSTRHSAQCPCDVVHSGRKCIGEKIPNVYLHYDSISNTVFVLVLQQETLPDSSWKPVVNIYSLGRNSSSGTNDTGTSSNFSWVMEGGHRIGWEGAFQMIPGTYDCDTGKLIGKAEAGKSGGKTSASEVEVIDTEKLFFGCQ